MMLRAVVVCLLLLFPLLVGPAEAIVVACPNGFNNCDPYSGTCYTAWTASLGGQVQANCAADPAACFLQSLTAPPTCDDPIPPPANPDAIRTCPALYDCFGAPNPYASLIHFPFPGPTLDSWRGQPGDVWECWSPARVAPDRIQLDALTCSLAFYCSDFPGNSSCNLLPDNVTDYRLLSFTNDRVPDLTYEPPSSTCPWDIRPAVPVTPCVLPVATMIAAMKNDSQTQWLGLSDYYKRLNKRIDRLGKALVDGRFGPPGSSRYMAKVGRQVWLIDLVHLIAQLVSDPPNPNYQSFPGPGVYPALTPLTPDATLTQAEIDALQAWLALLRAEIITARQVTDTIDNLAGAILAAEAGTPGAATWVRNLAVHADTALATLVTQGLAEITARAAVVAAGPSVALPAGCATPTSAANILKQAVQSGSTLYQGHLVYQEQLVTCGDALTDPAWMVTDAAEDAALWTSFAGFSIAAYLCGANAAYCAGAAPVIAMTPPVIDFGLLAQGVLSGVRLATVQNTGAAPLILGTVTVGGGDPTQFIKTAPKDFCSGKTLAPAATCTIGVKFLPTSAGVKKATLRVPSNDPVTPLATIKLQGTGSPASVAPAAIEFGSLAVGGLSPVYTVTVRNDGASAITMGAVSVSGTAPIQFIKTAPKDFCSGKVLAAGATCTIGVKFSPALVGPTTATLLIPSTVPTLSVTLTGTGI